MGCAGEYRGRSAAGAVYRVAAVKVSRKLSSDEVFEIVKASEAETSAAVKLSNAWGEHVAGDVYEERLLLDLVKSGRSNVSAVQVNGRPVYTIFWGVSDAGWLFVHAVVAMVKGADIRLAERAVVKLGREHGCKVAQCATIRAGMLNFLTAESWSPLGVVLIKQL